MDITKASLITGVGASAVTGVGGSAAGLTVLSSSLPIMGSIAGGATTIRMVKGLSKRRRLVK